jgi:hypothetical protein
MVFRFCEPIECEPFMKMLIAGLMKTGRGRALAMATVLLAGAISARAAEGLSESALVQIRALQQEKASRTPAQQKLDSQLVYALRVSRNFRYHQPAAER